jgi:Predicted transcriptional regulator
MLNRFKGLPHFDWMEEVMARLEDTFKLKSNVENVVCFDQNPYLQGLNYFTILFNAIINQKVLKICYRASFGEKQSYIIHPYFLKQYNNRWFLFGLYNGKIMNMALDRINSCEEILMPYIGNETINFLEYFQDIVGVTMPPDKSVKKIILKIEKNRYNYIATKPFHESQTELKDLSDNKSVVIKLELIPNYEFETLLLGFADSIEILEPISLKEKICKRANKIIQMNKKSAD